jgi:hypothetical protein
VSNDIYKILYVNSIVTYQPDNFVAMVMQPCVMRRRDMRLWIHYWSSCQACSWAELPEECDVQVLSVRVQGLEHPLMGVRPSGHVRCHVGHPCVQRGLALTVKPKKKHFS